MRVQASSLWIRVSFLFWALCTANSPGAGPASSPAAEPNTFTIPAYAFDRGNAKTFTDRWADKEPMIGFGGQTPAFAEYDIPFPVTGKYKIFVRYSAAGPRPVELLLDGERLADCCRSATGSWNTSTAKWEEAAEVEIIEGTHTLKLQRGGALPHITAIRLEGNQPFPAKWTLKRPKARTLDSPPIVAASTGKAARPAPAAPVPDPDPVYDPVAIRLAIEDLTARFPAQYRQGPAYLSRLAALEMRLQSLPDQAPQRTPDQQAQWKQVQQELALLQREALLANPLLDFEKLLLVKRHVKGPVLGLPRNWQSNSSLPKKGYDDEIALLSWRGDKPLETVFKPQRDVFVGDVELHFDADRLLFSSVGSHDRWQVFEVKLDGSGLRELTGQQPDVDSYDACYLPDGRIIFTSTACFVGVPCVYGSSHVANLYLMDADGSRIRQLCFDQEHDWCPTVLNNGRVLYARWEYTDTPHSNTRLLFHMNPDGTEQMEYLGSNSYWPNSFFYARPIPNHPTQVIAVIGGHHDHPRMGELVLFDPAQGRFENTSAVQRIPGRGKKVELLIRDGLTKESWPKFLHPYPLSDKYFLVACKPTPNALWGLYLADVFDNLVLIKELRDHALLEPIPLRETKRPPRIPDKVDPTRSDALVYVPDIYVGDGLKGVPRGTVKQLRLFTYHYAYQGMGGLLGVVGVDGPWDIKRVLGTVPVYADGSAKFRIPANVPISIQPLDEEGKALQLMRSWMTAMPGETVQCAGCHERQSTAPPLRNALALNRRPDEIQPWYGPLRGFSYAREVQPVIDAYCVGCHDGQARPDGSTPCDLRGTEKITDWRQASPGTGGKRGGKFSVGYAELHRFVRRPGIESDYHLLEPMEFHADTTELMQTLNRGHYGVQLDAESRDRLVTWIDLNCPFQGTWGEEIADPGIQRQRRRELLKLYANVDDDPEAVVEVKRPAAKPDRLESKIAQAKIPECPDWPFDAAEAQRRQAAGVAAVTRKIDLGDDVSLELVRIPAGQFLMGNPASQADDAPVHRVQIEKPLWMARLEITNRLYHLFDPTHDSRVEDKNSYQFGIHGYPSNQPEQPVVRVSWHEALAFCRWLSQKTGQPFTLPTEAQWEYACRAGTATPLSYGDLNADFSPFANMADAKLADFATNPYTVFEPLKNPSKYDDWIPKDTRFDDQALLAVEPGRYRPNAWGLCDMHGNVAEWTLSSYGPYPSRASDRGAAESCDGRKVVRGGSWRDRPQCCTSSYRLSYLPYQRVYNVGFRVVCPALGEAVAQK